MTSQNFASKSGSLESLKTRVRCGLISFSLQTPLHGRLGDSQLASHRAASPSGPTLRWSRGLEAGAGSLTGFELTASKDSGHRYRPLHAPVGRGATGGSIGKWSATRPRAERPDFPLHEDAGPGRFGHRGLEPISGNDRPLGPLHGTANVRGHQLARDRALPTPSNPTASSPLAQLCMLYVCSYI
jgi:hypothetical protein